MLDSSMSLQMSISVDELNCLNNALLGILTTLMFLYFYLFFFFLFKALMQQRFRASSIEFSFWLFRLENWIPFTSYLSSCMQQWFNGFFLRIFRIGVMAVSKLWQSILWVLRKNLLKTLILLSLIYGFQYPLVSQLLQFAISSKNYAFSFFSRCIHGS